jgi:hypothetical protein
MVRTQREPIMRRTHGWTYEDEARGLTIEGEVDYHITPGCRGVHTQHNGDPGWPDDPPEVELTNPIITDVTANQPVIIVPGGQILIIDGLTQQSAEEIFAKVDQDRLMDAILTDDGGPDEPEYEPDYDD